MKDIKLINFVDLDFEGKKMILNWRNHLEIRNWMYNQDEIMLEEHLSFIESLKLKKDKLYFLVKKEEEFLGVVYFTDADKNEIFYGIYSNPDSQIKGLGRILNEVSIDYAFNLLKVNKLKLEVFEENFKVRNLHKKYKFREISLKYVNNKKVICMELENENR